MLGVYTSLVLRGIQLGFSMVAFGMLLVGLPTYDYNGPTQINPGDSFETRRPRYNHQSHATPTTYFVMVLTFTSMVYSLGYAVIFELAQWMPPMKARTEAMVDAVFMGLYLGGSTWFSTSPLITSCAWFEANLWTIDCSCLSTSLHCCYLTLVTFAVALAWNWKKNRHAQAMSGNKTTYRDGATKLLDSPV